MLSSRALVTVISSGFPRWGDMKPKVGNHPKPPPESVVTDWHSRMPSGLVLQPCISRAPASRIVLGPSSGFLDSLLRLSTMPLRSVLEDVVPRSLRLEIQ